MQIVIPFLDHMRQACIEGKKTCTSRTKVYGNIGDRFILDCVAGNQREQAMFELTKIEQLRLSYVADNLYQAEGCHSHDEFTGLWHAIHPRLGFRPLQRVFTHHFKQVSLIHNY